MDNMDEIVLAIVTRGGAEQTNALYMMPGTRNGTFTSVGSRTTGVGC